MFALITATTILYSVCDLLRKKIGAVSAAPFFLVGVLPVVVFIFFAFDKFGTASLIRLFFDRLSPPERELVLVIKNGNRRVHSQTIVKASCQLSSRAAVIWPA